MKLDLGYSAFKGNLVESAQEWTAIHSSKIGVGMDSEPKKGWSNLDIILEVYRKKSKLFSVFLLKVEEKMHLLRAFMEAQVG